MPEADSTTSPWRLLLADERATAGLANELAGVLSAGDLLTLSGDLGAGKTTFARALIRALTGDPNEETPSPTFTLMQEYHGEHFPIIHADLFRIASGDELAELGWDEASEQALVIVEWPERAGDALTQERIDIRLDIAEDGSRIATITGAGGYVAKLARFRATGEMLRKAGWGGSRREFMLGDASTRAYERVKREDDSAVLMISPRRPDGPPIRSGKPYSAIAKLAESVHAFVALAHGLKERGFSAPDIYAQDLDAGLLLIEDLGSESVLESGAPIPDRYLASVEALALLHAQELPSSLPVPGAESHVIPPYDLDALLIETELLLDWYAPQQHGLAISAASRAEFIRSWTEALRPLTEAPVTWTLRDYHSPNLIWLPRRDGVARVGLIDFQDAVLGPPAYDVASLAQDVRVTVPEELELKLISHYVRLRRERDPAFDMAGFSAAYAIMAAQRATKILGIFVRLDKRDGKPIYLKHIPRIEKLLIRNLSHPVLSDVRGWYQKAMPSLFGDSEA
ncbi:tRNA (adenosine(37)-N6)-threonylcarbamoyltransferase complex ATPase subunit type 1 TsaE [Terrarubrum flagellatum]|uniref:tRNA (adenosine(37)-N6)-threonylcarbamoyltransferase complex ATPase subunit type 1 TsaE n=1 Tax=Terrirubrum flagellatum TaxID=2895980 RepID=UPI0031453397